MLTAETLSFVGECDKSLLMAKIIVEIAYNNINATWPVHCKVDKGVCEAEENKKN